MTQTTYYKATKSMTINDVPEDRNGKNGSHSAMVSDGWSKQKPDGWIAPEVPATDNDLLNMALAENEQLTAQLKTLKKSGNKKKDVDK